MWCHWSPWANFEQRWTNCIYSSEFPAIHANSVWHKSRADGLFEFANYFFLFDSSAFSTVFFFLFLKFMVSASLHYWRDQKIGTTSMKQTSCHDGFESSYFRVVQEHWVSEPQYHNTYQSHIFQTKQTCTPTVQICITHTIDSKARSVRDTSPEQLSSLNQCRRSNTNHRSRSPFQPESNASLILEPCCFDDDKQRVHLESYHQCTRRQAPLCMMCLAPSALASPGYSTPIGSWPLAAHELSSTARNQGALYAGAGARR